jgi:hypothetical protein
LPRIEVRRKLQGSVDVPNVSIKVVCNDVGLRLIIAA